jgi:hypothetical protein
MVSSSASKYEYANPGESWGQFYVPKGDWWRGKIKGSLQGPKRCSKGKSCGATCIATSKVCRIELEVKGVGDLRDRIAKVLEGKDLSKLRKPKPKPVKPASPGSKVFGISREDEKFLPKQKVDFPGSNIIGYEDFLKSRERERNEAIKYIKEIREKEKQLGRKYKNSEIRRMMDLKYTIAAREKELNDPKTNKKYIPSIKADLRKLRNEQKNLEEG